MKTLLKIALFELQLAFRGWGNLILSLIFMLFAFFIMNVFGGAIESVKVAIAGENTKLNSLPMLSILFAYLNLFGAIILASFGSKLALKDIDYNAYQLTYTLPITKIQLLVGKYLATLSLCLFVFFSGIIGVYLATLMPYLDTQQFGPNSLINYLSPMFTITIPVAITLSVLFFGVGTMFKNHFSNWLVLILLYGFYYGALQLNSELDYTMLAAILDPFGAVAVENSQIGMTSEQINQGQGVDLVYIIANRLIWLVIGVVFLILSLSKFTFQQMSSSKTKSKKSKSVINANQKEIITDRLQTQPPFKLYYNLAADFKKFMFMVKEEWSNLFRNNYFKIILGIGLAILCISTLAIDKQFDTQTYPVAYKVAETFLFATKIFMFVLITIFSGEMVWRERINKIHLVGDALPVNSSLRFFSKFTALSVLLLYIYLVMIVVGVLVQYMKGYSNYEIDLLSKIILGVGFPKLLFIVGLSFVVQSLVNNRFTGYFLMVAYYIFDTFFIGNLIEDPVLALNAGIDMMYSDMNGFGYNVPAHIVYRIYWLSFIVLFLVLANKFYPKGIEIGFNERWIQFKTGFHNNKFIAGVIGLLLIFLSCGGFVFYNVHILNDYSTEYAFKLKQSEYEKKYAKYKDVNQPSITDVKISADLFPENGALSLIGHYIITNKSNQPISEIHIYPSKVDSIWYTTPVIAESDDDMFRVYQLQQPLVPGESTELHFKLDHNPKGFSKGGVESLVDKNGTFINSSILPSIGYNESMELAVNSDRRKFDLPEKQKLDRSLNDPKALNKNILDINCQVNLEITASTANNQKIIAPGKLIKKWTSNGRNYFNYKTQRPINNFYSILSANYKEEQKFWQSESHLNKKVLTEINYHEPHKYNVPNMMDGMHDALDYYSSHFSPFQYDELRIGEFPRYESFAQSFSGCIPFSEGIGFIADLRKVSIDSVSLFNAEDAVIDYPYYITAHEVAHQWWAHQVMAAKTEGATFIIETLSQYSALMVMKERYGKERMRKFLALEGFGYLSSRGEGSHNENPLITVASDEKAVHYKKGSVVMYALQDYIGEHTVNKVLKAFVKKYAFKNAPYPTSDELINEFEKVTPDSLKYIINDWFREVTLYKNKIVSATYERNQDLEYVVEINIDIQKFNYDENGKELEAEVNDYIPIAIYNKKENQIYNQKVKVKKGENKIMLKLSRRPHVVILDPNAELLDKDWTMKKKEIKNKIES